MRQRSATTLAIMIWLVTFWVALSPAATDRCELPPGLRDKLLKDYPNTRLVGLADLDEHDRQLFQKDHGTRCPGFVRVDFYGDGKPTWALVLISEENPGRKALVVAHHVAQNWEPPCWRRQMQLQSSGARPLGRMRTSIGKRRFERRIRSSSSPSMNPGRSCTRGPAAKL